MSQISQQLEEIDLVDMTVGAEVWFYRGELVVSTRYDGFKRDNVCGRTGLVALAFIPKRS